MIFPTRSGLALTTLLALALALGGAGPAEARKGKRGRVCREDLRVQRYIATANKGDVPEDPGLLRRIGRDGVSSNGDGSGPSLALIAVADRCVPTPPVPLGQLVRSAFPFSVGNPPQPWPDADMGEAGTSTAPASSASWGPPTPYPQPGALGRTGMTVVNHILGPKRSARLDRGIRTRLNGPGGKGGIWLLSQRRGQGMYGRSEVRGTTAQLGEKRFIIVEHRLSQPTPDTDGHRPLLRSRVWVLDARHPVFPLAELNYPDEASTAGRPLLWCLDPSAAARHSCPPTLPRDPRTVKPECQASEARWLVLKEQDGKAVLETRSYTCTALGTGRYGLDTMRTLEVLPDRPMF